MYFLVFIIIQEASKKEYKFCFLFPPLLKMPRRERMQWENEVKSYKFYIKSAYKIAFLILCCEFNQFIFYKKRNSNTGAYISTE